MRDEIISELMAYAKEVYSEFPVMQRVVVTQGLHESGLLRSQGGSALALTHHNLFGIKGKGDNGSTPQPTWEHLHGKDVKVIANFASYSSYKACFEAHKRLMQKDRYREVLLAESPEKAFEELWEAGYATDPSYPSKLEKVYDKVVKPAFDDL